MALVRDGTTAQKANAAGALYVLAQTSRHIQKLIGSAGGIPPLVALMRDGTDAQKANAAFALAYLAASQRGRISECVQMDAEIWSRAESLPTLVVLVRDGTDDQKESAADALRFMVAVHGNYVAAHGRNKQLLPVYGLAKTTL